MNYLQFGEVFLPVWIKIDKFKIILIKVQQMRALFFLTLLQMTPKSMSKYFQTLKGWINCRIITLDAIRLVFILRFLVNIHVMNMYTSMTKWRLCLKSDGVAVFQLIRQWYSQWHSYKSFSHSTVNHQFLISSISNNKKDKAKLVMTNLYI